MKTRIVVTCINEVQMIILTIVMMIIMQISQNGSSKTKLTISLLLRISVHTILTIVKDEISSIILMSQ